VTRLLINLNEVAEKLAVTRRTVENLISRGQLASVKVGRARRVALADLEDYVQRNREV
jgi:excisionase family DNA binding protein